MISDSTKVVHVFHHIHLLLVLLEMDNVFKLLLINLLLHLIFGKEGPFVSRGLLISNINYLQGNVQAVNKLALLVTFVLQPQVIVQSLV